jgi:hypothetical protein
MGRKGATAARADRFGTAANKLIGELIYPDCTGYVKYGLAGILFPPEIIEKTLAFQSLERQARGYHQRSIAVNGSRS